MENGNNDVEGKDKPWSKGIMQRSEGEDEGEEEILIKSFMEYGESPGTKNDTRSIWKGSKSPKFWN